MSATRRTALTALAAGLLCGCTPRSPGDTAARLPEPGVAGRREFIVKDSATGPIVLIFPGRSAPTDDPTLGIRGTAMRIARKVDGSVAIFSWMSYPLARKWVEREAAERRAAGRPARLALVGHSWGGEAASEFVREVLKTGAVDDVPVLVTIDSIHKGYVGCFLRELPSMLTLEIFFRHRLALTGYARTPVPDGRGLLRHVNYYQQDSPQLCGRPIRTASENHEVWLDRGREPGHGNLDNLVAEFVAEDVRRACLMEPRQ